MKKVITKQQHLQVIQFRPNFYTHKKGYYQHKCWKCEHKFIDGDAVHVIRCSDHNNYVLCTECAVNYELPLDAGFIEYDL